MVLYQETESLPKPPTLPFSSATFLYASTCAIDGSFMDLLKKSRVFLSAIEAKASV